MIGLKEGENQKESRRNSEPIKLYKKSFPGGLQRVKDFFEDKALDVEIAIESRFKQSSDFKTQQLIKRAARHRLDKKEIIELLASIGYTQADARRHVQQYFKAKDKLHQTRLR